MNEKELMIEAFIQMDNEDIVKFFDVLNTKFGGQWVEDWFAMIHENMADRLEEMIDSGEVDVSGVKDEKDAVGKLFNMLK
jgi:hypothetical protein